MRLVSENGFEMRGANWSHLNFCPRTPADGRDGTADKRRNGSSTMTRLWRREGTTCHMDCQLWHSLSHKSHERLPITPRLPHAFPQTVTWGWLSVFNSVNLTSADLYARLSKSQNLPFYLSSSSSGRGPDGTDRSSPTGNRAGIVDPIILFALRVR